MVHGGNEDHYSTRSTRQEMVILQKLRRSQSETAGRTHLRGKRHLGDRTYSTAIVCYRATRQAASVLTTHHKTNEYKDAVRKSGVAHGQSGLNATEQETRRATRKAKSDIRTARALDRQWNDRTLTCKDWVRWQEDLLRAYWYGSLDRRLKEALESRGNADPMCRTPLQPPRL